MCGVSPYQMGLERRPIWFKDLGDTHTNVILYFKTIIVIYFKI